ncbi:hypothetical protein [Stenotrophomonas sp.]|uniref:hypothetical protein n=1 Tax=Stenotrophomonas sp. TaxID=69392 RepID=UPI0028AA0BEB|nr:hypothetical protein [Stenotrophomonas sp.]
MQTKLTEGHCRELLKALYSTERLAHLFRRTSYYSEEPARAFLDALWITAETGAPPSSSTKKALRKYLNSNNLPHGDECTGADHLGQHFILSLHLLLSFIKKRDTDDLEYILSNVEGGHIFDLAIEELTKNSGTSTTLITKELSERVNSLPISVNFRNQLEIDERKSHSISLDRASIESSKAGSIDDISWSA